MCYNNAMDKGYAPEKLYLKMTPQAARALGALAQSQSGEMTDPRMVAWSMIEEMFFARGMITEKSLPCVEWPGEQE